VTRIIPPLKIFFDGGCRPNPGRIEVAVVARGQTRFFDNLGQGTSSDAEWLALCLSLEVAHALAEPIFDLVGDSRSVIDQASGAVPCHSLSDRRHRARYEDAAAALPPRRLRWVPRQQNLAGIALARRHQSAVRGDVTRK
jgi:ribonuclease HI